MCDAPVRYLTQMVLRKVSRRNRDCSGFAVGQPLREEPKRRRNSRLARRGSLQYGICEVPAKYRRERIQAEHRVQAPKVCMCTLSVIAGQPPHCPHTVEVKSLRAGHMVECGAELQRDALGDARLSIESIGGSKCMSFYSTRNDACDDS